MTTQSIEGAMPPLPEPPRNISLSGVDWWHAWEVRAIHAYAKAYAAPLLARVAELQAALTRLSEQCDRLRLPGCPMSDAEKFAKEVLLNQGAS